MKTSFTIGKYKNAPINVHWTFIFALPVFYLLSGNVVTSRSIGAALLGLIAYLGLMIAHELGHAFMAARRGLDVLEIKAYPMHGICIHEQAQREIDDIWIAWAGVGAQVLLLIPAWGLAHLLKHFHFEYFYLLQPLFAVLISVNIMTIFFNLIPYRGLDGALAWRFIPRLFKSQRRRLTLVVDDIRPRSKQEKQQAAQIAQEALRKIMERQNAGRD